jgi:hypothetical protein
VSASWRAAAASGRPVAPGVTVHRFERLGAEAALGLVVDALESEIVGGLGDDAQVARASRISARS